MHNVGFSWTFGLFLLSPLCRKPCTNATLPQHSTSAHVLQALKPVVFSENPGFLFYSSLSTVALNVKRLFQNWFNNSSLVSLQSLSLLWNPGISLTLKFQGILINAWRVSFFFKTGFINSTVWSDSRFRQKPAALNMSEDITSEESRHHMFLCIHISLWQPPPFVSEPSQHT